MKINQFKYCFLAIALGLIASQPGFSQKISSPSVIGAAGEISRAGDMTIEWTLGEVFVASGNDNTTWHTEGYHQPVLFVKENSKTLSSSYDVKIFPNPATDILNVLIRTNLSDALVLKVIDVTGRVVFMQDVSGGPNDIRLKINDLPEGMFILSIVNSSGYWIKSFKIIKHS